MGMNIGRGFNGSYNYDLYYPYVSGCSNGSCGWYQTPIGDELNFPIINVERLSDGTVLSCQSGGCKKISLSPNSTATGISGLQGGLDFDIDSLEKFYVIKREYDRQTKKYNLSFSKYDLGGNLIFSKEIITNESSGNIDFENLEVSGDEVIIIGTKNNNETGKDVIVYIYDLDGNLKYTKTFDGELDESVSDFVVIDNNNYAFIGTSKSSEFEGIKNEGTQLAYLVTATRVFDITVEQNEGGKVETKQEGEKGYVIITPDDKYAVTNVTVKDKEGNEIPVTIDNINKYIFDLDRDIYVTVEFSPDYDITLDVKKGGEATSEKLEENNGRVKVVPNTGYEVDEVIIKDTTGKEVVYTEKDGIYNFKLTDDVTVTITFKELPKEVVKGEEENPKTADAFIYYACAVVSSLFGIWSVEQYRKTKVKQG